MRQANENVEAGPSFDREHLEPPFVPRDQRRSEAMNEARKRLNLDPSL